MSIVGVFHHFQVNCSRLKRTSRDFNFETGTPFQKGNKLASDFAKDPPFVFSGLVLANPRAAKLELRSGQFVL